MTVAAAGLCAATASWSGASHAQPTASGDTPELRVVVRAAPGAGPLVERGLRAHGGHLTAHLPLIGGFSARTTAAGAERLRHTPGVLAVTPDGPVTLASVDPALGYDPAGDFGSLYDVTRVARVQDAWRSGITGKGVDVALIDSGVAPVLGLTSGNVVNGPDLSFESQEPGTAHLDTFGHGTHMAGIIVGRDSASTPAGYADPSHFTGVAPDSHLVNVKVATHDGATDVSQVIAALDWVAQHAHDPGHNIRVVNLSFGTDSVQDVRTDPLVFAAEAAWRSGLVVVVAGGNEGDDRKLLSDPAMSPQVLAVGAEDPHGSVETIDDLVPTFASLGTFSRHVDLVAPAVHVLSLAVPGSQVATDFPTGRVGARFLRGSGTSQAAAVTSGAAALYLQKYPTATPAQVKRALMLSAAPFPGGTEMYRGAGALDVRRALTLSPSQVAPVPGTPVGPIAGTGTGALEGSRGSAHVVDGTTPLTGEKDIFGKPFHSSVWAPLSLGGRAWTGGAWNGSTWTGSGWDDQSSTGTGWSPTTWTGSSWAGRTWTGRTWTGRTWTSSGWSAGSWSGSTWTGRTWTGRTWTGSSWSDASWD